MNTTLAPTTGGALGRSFITAEGCILGPSFGPWLELQSPGQEKIIRFRQYAEEFGTRIRHQNGHAHRASVCFLFTYMMIRMRPHVSLDEPLLMRCINHHDEPEGVIEEDVLAPNKTDQDDLNEYGVFETMYRHLGPEVWTELQRAFLLQFCLKDPECFPDGARRVMRALAERNRNEALFFDGVQRLDYLYYAYECSTRGVHKVLKEVAGHQIEKLDRIAQELPGFAKEAWTREAAIFFANAARSEGRPEPDGVH